MFPLKDDIPARRLPIVTTLIIALNCVVFLIELMAGRRVENIFLMYGLIPARYTIPDISNLFNLQEQVLPFIFSMFIHGGWTHLIGNMWTLWVFGDNVEDKLGSFRFLIFYIIGGVAAAIMHILTNADSPIPTIGASGAVASVMGAYFRFFPGAKIMTMIPPFIFGPFFKIPAILFLGWWFVLQFFNGTLALAENTKIAAGVAWWAHIGGFLFGIFLSTIVLPKRRRDADWEWV
ncbi:MAG TPA: rhomboid family intramembrane serine protease [Verrucomicrobiota bacterium]|nr:rhomboid family intramembrane serine protease [Verrucomicrobiota bacterium]